MDYRQTELPLPQVPGVEERPRWPARYGIFALIAAIGGTYAYFILFGGALILPLAPLSFFKDRDVKGAIGLLVVMAIQDSIFVLAAIGFASVAQPLRRRLFGLRRVKIRKAVLWVLIGFLIYVPFEIFWFAVVVNGGKETVHSVPIAAAILVGIVIVVFAPTAEEFLFRGFMFQAFRNRMGFWGAAALNGLLFGAIHVGTYAPQDTVPLAVFGFAACTIFQRTNSLYPSIAMHALNNAVVYTLVFL